MGYKGDHRLSKKGVVKAYFSWMQWNLTLQNMERMQGPSIIKMLCTVKDELYPNDPKQQQALLARHTAFFNTEPYLGSIVPGIILGMEKQKADGTDIPDDLITGIKTALMGPFAGIGDSLLPGTLIPILLSIGLGLSTTGSVVGPLFYIVVFLGIMLPLTWFLFTSGVNMGASAAEMILSGGIKDKLTKAVDIVGLVVVGYITAQYANFVSGIIYKSGNMTININAMLDSIMPKLPVLLMAFLTLHLMSDKKWSVTKIMGLFLLISIIGYFTKIVGVVS